MKKTTLRIDEYIENQSSKVEFKEPEKVKSLPLMSDLELGQLIEKRRFEAMRKRIVNNPETRCEFK